MSNRRQGRRRRSSSFRLLEPVGCQPRWLVDDAQHFKTGNLACILVACRCKVVEAVANGDDGLRHILAEIGSAVSSSSGRMKAEI